MYNRKKIWIKASNKIIMAFLSIIGFASCNNSEKEDADMYGVPSADYIINGYVKSAATNEAIEGIEVRSNTVQYTDENGNFTLEFRNYSVRNNHTFRVDFYDGDDTLNGGHFQYKDTLIEFTNPTYNGGNGWNQGEAVKNVEIKLDLEDNGN